MRSAGMISLYSTSSAIGGCLIKHSHNTLTANWLALLLQQKRRIAVFERGTRFLPLVPKVQERSDEHTSELPSLMSTSYTVFCLKKQISPHNTLQQPPPRQ